MQKTKILLGAIIALVIAFIGLKVFQLETYADYVRPVILPLLLLYYCLRYKDRSSNYYYFLFFYALSEILTITYYLVEVTKLVDDIMYYGCNFLYILAYSFLIIEVTKGLSFTRLMQKFSFLIIVLIALDVYTVILVSDVAASSEWLGTLGDYILEIVYNSVIMVLLTVALINYLYRDSNKAMTLLVGSLCIVFSEVIQVAYFYVSDIKFLDILYSVLLVLAFLFFHLQTKMSYEEISIIKESKTPSLKELEELKS